VKFRLNARPDASASALPGLRTDGRNSPKVTLHLNKLGHIGQIWWGCSSLNHRNTVDSLEV